MLNCGLIRTVRTISMGTFRWPIASGDIKALGMFLALQFLFGSAVSQPTSKSDKPSIQRFREQLTRLNEVNPQAYTDSFLDMEEAFLRDDERAYLIELYKCHVDFLYRTADYDSIATTLHKIRALLSQKQESASDWVYLQLAIAHHAGGQVDSFRYWQERAAKFVHPGSPLYGERLLTEAILSTFDGSYALAIDKTLQAIDLLIQQKDTVNLAIAYNQISTNYHNLKQFHFQQEYLLKAIELNRSIVNKYFLIQNFNNMGGSFKQQDRLDEALMYYDSAYELLQSFGHPLLLAQNLTNRANVLEKKGDYKRAAQLFGACMQISKENGLTYGEMLSSLNMGNLYRLKKEYAKAAEYLQHSLALARTLKTRKEEALAYERLSWLARDRADYKDAYDLKSRYHALYDSLVNERVQIEASTLKEKYAAEKRENEIISLKNEKLFQQYVLALMGLGLLSLFLLYQWRMHRVSLLERARQMEQQRLQYELDLKEKELLADSLKKVSILNTKAALLKDLRGLIADLPAIHASKFTSILKELDSGDEQSLLKEFDTRFLGVYEGFFTSLKAAAPDLTPTELRIAALTRLNFSSKEIALITSRTVGTIDNMRSSIRKKLNLREDDNLLDVLLGY